MDSTDGNLLRFWEKLVKGLLKFAQCRSSVMRKLEAVIYWESKEFGRDFEESSV